MVVNYVEKTSNESSNSDSNMSQNPYKDRMGYVEIEKEPERKPIDIVQEIVCDPERKPIEYEPERKPIDIIVWEKKPTPNYTPRDIIRIVEDNSTAKPRLIIPDENDPSKLWEITFDPSGCTVKPYEPDGQITKSTSSESTSSNKYFLKDVVSALLNEEQINFLKDTAYITGIGIVCGTIANCDKLIPALIRDPYGFLKFMTKQLCGNFVQNSLCQIINYLINNNSYINTWKSLRSGFTRKCVSALQYTSISIGLSSIRSFYCDDNNERSWYDFCSDIAENIIQNNLTMINNELTSRWVLWKSITGQITSFTIWLQEFISSKCGATLIGKYLGYILTSLGIFEAGPIVSGVLTILCTRLVKQLAFDVSTGFLSLCNHAKNRNRSIHRNMIEAYNDRYGDDDEGNDNSSKLNEEERSELRSKYQKLKDNQNRTFEDTMKMYEINDTLNDSLDCISQLSISYEIKPLYNSPIPSDTNCSNISFLDASSDKFEINYKPKKIVTNYRPKKIVTNYKQKKIVTNYKPKKIKNNRKDKTKISHDCKKSDIVKMQRLDYSKLDDSKSNVEKIIKAEVIADVVPTSAYVIQKTIDIIANAPLVNEVVPTSAYIIPKNVDIASNHSFQIDKLEKYPYISVDNATAVY